MKISENKQAIQDELNIDGGKHVLTSLKCFKANMYIEHIILHVFLDYGNIQFSIRYSSKLRIYKKKWGGDQNLLSFKKTKEPL